MATSDTLSRGHSVCQNEPATGPLGVNISAFRFKLHFQKFWKCDLRLLFLLNHKSGGVAQISLGGS